MSDYLTLEELKATRELTGTTFADSDMQLAISAASRGVEGATGRRFWLDASDVTRYYTARSTSLVSIDDLADPTSVTVGGTTWTENTQYAFEPLNALADGRPFNTITALSGAFPLTVRAIAVTGQFGWLDVPAPVKQAAGILASRLLLRHREAPFGVVLSGIEVGAAARIAKSDPDVLFLLEPYMEGVLVA
jgi:hypothetical protein